LYKLAGLDPIKREHCTVVSCGGKWTIPPIANLLKQFGIPFRIIHDLDKKQRSDNELAATVAMDPYRANARIAQFVRPENLFAVDDTLEDLFWHNKPASSGDKPYRVWKRVIELLEDPDSLDPKVKDLIKFAFDW
jgi:hypothetical protein